MNLTLVYPMAALVALTFSVAIAMLYSRIMAIRTGQMKPGYFETFSKGSASDQVLKTGRHFSNLFELPVLFYTGCIVGLVVGTHSSTFLNLAWLFVCARAVHAYIHLGSNKVIPRMFSYLAGWIIVIGMWVILVAAVP